MSNIPEKYDDDLKLIHNICLFNKDQKAFNCELEQFDKNALRAYIVLASYIDQKSPLVAAFDNFSQLLTVLVPDRFFSKLNESKKLLDCDKNLSTYLIDAFEVMANATNCVKTEQFYVNCHANLRIALKNEHPNVISIYLQILHRLDRVFETKTPIEILKTIIEAVHGPINDVKLLNEALLLIESNLQQRHNLADQSMANAQLLNFMWQNLCSSRVAKHQCNICYTIISQLIKIYIKECQVNESFCNSFLSSEIWHFIRAAIESKEMVRRKQAIYILQNILETNQKEIMNTDDISDATDTDLQNIWKNYFAILESLLEIQCHLIISCLEQYLDGIVKYLPQFWYSIIFALILKHHNNVVIHYGIEFILHRGILLQHDSHLLNGFYQALNNTYLHSEAKISEENLAKYFQNSDMNHTLDIMLLISWQPVPLWTVIKSIDIYVQLNKGVGFQVQILLDFLKRSVRVIKNMPEVDDMTVSILQNIGINKLTLEQVLGLYDIIPRTEILDGYRQPLDLQKFELNFVQLNNISIETKINYFRHAIPVIKDQSTLLDEFYEKNRSMICYFPHYEFLLFNNMCTEKSLKDALFVLKPRIYNLMKPHGNITLEALNFSASLLKFVVDKFASDCSDAATFDAINKTVVNFHDVIRKKLYVDGHTNKLSEIKEQLTTISMKMTKCIELYPNKLAVLGVLADVMMLENENIDLSRFNPNNENDVRAIQGLYDCFIDKSYEFKPAHQANVVLKILSNFRQLELDIWKAYRILLAGKLDVSCIFEQTHSYTACKIDEILADALIYGVELKGEEKQAYDFVSSKSGSITYNQKVRLTAMRAIAAKQQLEQIQNVKNLLFTKNTEIYRVRYYTNSHHHSMKLRITQALAFLFRLDPKWDGRMLDIILEEANQTNVTHINELILAETVDPLHMLTMIENIEGNKGLQSMFMMIYYVCSKDPSNIHFARECIEFLIKYIFVKQIIVRTSAQIVLIKLCEKFDLINEFKILYDSTKIAHEVKVSRALKFSYAYKYRFEQIDANQMLHTMYTLREIPRITKMFSDEYYKHEIFDSEESNMAINMDEDESLTAQESVDVEMAFIENGDDTIIHHGHGGNVQRKLVTYRETFIDRQILNSLSDEFMRRDMKSDSNLIILASLLTKPANLGGLSRAGEVFGVKSIALDNLKHLKHNDFTSISMASEKWVKFLEVKHYNVINYLMAMKASGYAIVGAEQTAFGDELNKTSLPRKMVLVLGHEKDGIPANILNLLDMAVEVPQFGVVRSLNVHVTASLFMWEYCKQHIIADAKINISR
ncbi:uncharacterized protein LOC116340876 [Contarinia nasturtii]|uniref:uncharacterized protein LOC116340876 n=1 Tax=Contarinia nasturtii TaxID=265458 RepID=UPI0012D3ADD2|nr:uncharacterized protein LOC116340876 [Contarinia nasturtii]